MPSTDEQPGPAGTYVPSDPAMDLTLALNSLSADAWAYGLPIVGLDTTAGTGTIHVTVPTRDAVYDWVNSFGVDPDSVKTDVQADLGITITSFSMPVLGRWSAHVQHVHVDPTIQEGTSGE